MTNPYRALCAELADELHEHTCLYEGHESELVARARALLAEPEAEGPVPVSERLPGAGDCLPWPGEPDETHWCWMSRIVNGFSGRFVLWEQVSVGPACRDVYTHWLPANALPTPRHQ